jgi:hypothetical protein
MSYNHAIAMRTQGLRETVKPVKIGEIEAARRLLDSGALAAILEGTSARLVKAFAL